MVDTKERILDAAERLFGKQGYFATSVRQIIAEAGVNLAAIHYHYGSKGELLAQVVHRKADPASRERLEALEHLESAASGGPLDLQEILEAFFAPAMNRAAANPEFLKLMGKLYREALLPSATHRHFRHVQTRYLAALGRALPGLSPIELCWRFQLTISAAAHLLSANLEDESLPDGAGVQQALRRLIAFASGGLSAPDTDSQPVQAV
jgi:AcrR family transcriptional regulator